MKKFLTVLLALSVVFTYSFATVSTAFAATSIEDANEQALANAKTYAVSSLENFVRLSDYDADGQAQVKEIIEEGTTLINLQTSLDGVTTTLVKYQQKLLAVESADKVALATAKKAAKESIDDYVALLTKTGAYDAAGVNALNAKANAGKTSIDKQVTVFGVEFARDNTYAEIEKVKMAKTVSDAEVAKALAEAKAAAIETVKGLNKTGWAVIDEKVATDKQIADYKAKVAQVVADIKAATSLAEVGKYVREKAEVEDLAAATEKAAAQAAVKEGIVDWAKGLDYAQYADVYATIKACVENVTFGSTSNALRLNGTLVTYRNDNVVVDEVKDVDSAVAKAIDFIKDQLDSKLGTAQAKAKAAVQSAAVKYAAGYDALAAAERAIDEAATVADIDAIKAGYAAEWKTAHMAKNDAYQEAVEKAEAEIAAAYTTVDKATLTADEAKVLDEVKTAVLKEIKNDYLYDNFLVAGYNGHIKSNVDTFKQVVNSVTTQDIKYADCVTLLKAVVADDFKVVAGDDTGLKVLKAQAAAAIEAATTITDVYATVLEWKEALNNYEPASATDANIERYAAFKSAVAAVEALPALDEVTIADKDAVVAAYKAYVNDGVLTTEAYVEAYGRVPAFVGEAEALAKIERLYAAVTSALPNKVELFKADAYKDFLNSTAYNKYTAAQKAELDKIYADALAAMNTAPDTSYANDIDYIVTDALAAMADVANKYAAEDLTSLIADAKAFLKTVYNPADYTAADLANIEAIIATVDGAKNAKDVAKLTIAARKAIAAVGKNEIDEKAAAIQAVEALKIVKNHSTVGKGYIKIAWSTIGDDSYVDGYQVYRSTKMNKGFGTKPIFTTTNKTYKNTKSLKKGIRYYYKVRAFVEIDGVKYYSDWSNKAYRVAK